MTGLSPSGVDPEQSRDRGRKPHRPCECIAKPFGITSGPFLPRVRGRVAPSCVGEPPTLPRREAVGVGRQRRCAQRGSEPWRWQACRARVSGQSPGFVQAGGGNSQKPAFCGEAVVEGRPDAGQLGTDGNQGHFFYKKWRLAPCYGGEAG